MIKKAISIILISQLAIINVNKLKALSIMSAHLASKVLSYNKDYLLKQDDKSTRILKVPAEFSTIAAAVANSNEGDWIIIFPGTYVENEIEINKGITISSEWKLSGDESKIDQTIVNAEDKRLFIISARGVEISGLKIINGDHTLDISANVTVMHNHFINNLDGMSFESGGGGYVAYNTAENDRDDALDLDIVSDDNNFGSDILVENNVFINCADDGIEIRLFKPQNQNINYTIRYNQIIGSNNAGIQLISYDKFTGKVFNIHHNIFINCKTGLGCMEGAKTREDLSGASKMDEQVYFYNNTIIGNKIGATGGNNIIAFNNLVAGNSLGGFKLFGANSVIINNLFFQNGGNDFIEIDQTVVKKGNIFSTDPLLDENTFYPTENSPCVDAGIAAFEDDGIQLPKISLDNISGKAPDIGAIERGMHRHDDQQTKPLQIDAGEDRVIESPASEVVLAGRIRNADDISFNCIWKQEKGPAEAELVNPDKLVTKVILNQEGIYQFSINCSNGKSTASDFITIRYINEGEGKQLFLSEGKTNIIEAENFAYTYGKVKKIRKRYFKLEGNMAENDIAQMEFSIGMAEGSEYELWFLIKFTRQGENKLRIEFNQKNVGEISPKDKKFHWVKIPRKIKTTPGQWPLLISNTEGRVFLDKIIFTQDPNFIPD